MSYIYKPEKWMVEEIPTHDAIIPNNRQKLLEDKMLWWT